MLSMLLFLLIMMPSWCRCLCRGRRKLKKHKLHRKCAMSRENGEPNWKLSLQRCFPMFYIIIHLAAMLVQVLTYYHVHYVL